MRKTTYTNKELTRPLVSAEWKALSLGLRDLEYGEKVISSWEKQDLTLALSYKSVGEQGYTKETNKNMNRNKEVITKTLYSSGSQPSWH